MDTIVKQIVRGTQIGFFVWMFITCVCGTCMAFAGVGIAEGYSQVEAIICTLVMDFAYIAYVVFMWRLFKN